MCGSCSAGIGARRSIDTHPRIALSGVRSSCESVARNSSFNRLARSASSRAACSAMRTSSSSYWRVRPTSAARTVLTTAAMGTGRSSSVTLRRSSSSRSVRSSACERSPAVKSSTGISDHAGWARSAVTRSGSPRSPSPSSVNRIAPAPLSNSVHNAAIVGHTWHGMEARLSRSRVRSASRPTGAKMSTRMSCAGTAVSGIVEERASRAHVARHTCQHALELGQGVADANGVGPDAELADGRLVSTGAFLDDGNCLAHGAVCLEETQQHDTVGQIAEIDRRRHHRADDAVLRHDDQRRSAFRVEIREQLEEAHQRRVALRDRAEISIHAVDHDDLRAVGVDVGAYLVAEFAGGDFARFDLGDRNVTRPYARRQAHPERVASRDEGTAPFFEEIHGGAHRIVDGGDELRRDRRFAAAGGANDEGGAAPGEAAAEQAIERGQPAGDGLGPWCFGAGANQLREYPQAAALYLEVLKAFERRHTAHLDDAEPPARAPVLEGQLFQLDHAVREALQLQVALGPVMIVQQQDGARSTSQELLQREDLAAIAERFAREQPHFGQRVEDDPRRAEPLDDVENPLNGLDQLDFRRVIERVLVLKSRAFGRRELRDLDPLEGPAVRIGDGPQFDLRLRERDVEAGFTAFPALDQKLHRERRLAGAWIAFDEVYPVGREAAAEQLIESFDAGRDGCIHQTAGIIIPSQ